MKPLALQLAGDEFLVKYLRRTIHATSALRHLHVVHVESLERSADGRPFIVMEYAPGLSLRELIARGGFIPALDVVKIATQICTALHSAHRLEIIHQNLKPDNVIVAEEHDGVPHAKVREFGMADLREAAAERGKDVGDVVVMDHGAVVGTFEYMSPEQAAGTPSRLLDGRTDLYSLGVMMFEALTGELPIHTDDPASVLHRLETTAEKELLCRTVMTALSKDRDNRYSSAAEMAVALRDVADSVVDPTSAEAGFDPGSGAVNGWVSPGASQPRIEDLHPEPVTSVGELQFEVKCPKCGFVSYPGIPHCKKCGYSLLPAKQKEEPSHSLSLFSGAGSSSPGQVTQGPPSPKESSFPPLEELNPPEAEPPAPGSSAIATTQTTPEDRPTETVRPWKQELSQRVEDLPGKFDLDANLELDFKGERSAEAAAALDSEVIEFPQRHGDLDVILENPAAADGVRPMANSFPLDRPKARSRSLDSTPVGIGEHGLEAEWTQPRPAEIVLDHPPPGEDTESVATLLGLPLAPLGRRFLGGIIDALVLTVAAVVFALIFWRAGGHMSPQPLNLAVVAFIAAAFIMSYFGVFIALTSTTPGLLWLGIEARSLHGGIPTAKQAFWRAFGYLVSISALMLGFLWALVDSDGLTWHDRMSDTCLTDAESAVESRESTVNS